MDKLPRVIATSVVRSAHQGESHGGVYLIDLNTNSFSRGYIIRRTAKLMHGFLKRIANPAPAAFHLTFFDPNDSRGPRVGPNSSSLHINNVSHHDGLITIAGTTIESLLEL